MKGTIARGTGGGYPLSEVIIAEAKPDGQPKHLAEALQYRRQSMFV